MDRPIELAGLCKPDKRKRYSFEKAMASVDHARCLFTVTPTGDGDRGAIHFEFIDKNLSALERPTRRIFFSLKKDITWEQAEELAVHLNVLVATTSVAEYAPGE